MLPKGYIDKLYLYNTLIREFHTDVALNPNYYLYGITANEPLNLITISNHSNTPITNQLNQNSNSIPINSNTTQTATNKSFGEFSQ